MRRLLALALASLLPLHAVAQSLAVQTHDLAERLLAQQPDDTDQGLPRGSLTAPLWRGADGSMLMLTANDHAPLDYRADAPLSFSATHATTVFSTGVSYRMSPSLQANANVTQHAWLGYSAGVTGSELGATYNAGRYSVGFSLGADSSNDSSARLPRVLPGVTPGVNGLYSFDNSTQVNARGRLALDSHSGIDLGASMGRIHLLPGNLMGVDSLDQRALSFGVDRGPVTGSIVGREMQPSTAMPGAYNPDRRWSSIDLGVTWHLPWQGQLSFGAQNLWSSGGSSANTPVGSEPDQSRTPYVQYHQDL